MSNIKQRAQELLTCDELRGRVPDEVQALLRDIVALEPVASRAINARCKGYFVYSSDFSLPQKLYALGPYQ